MKKIPRLYIFMILSVMTTPTAIFANYSSSPMAETNSNNHQRQMYDNDLYNQEKQRDGSNLEIIGDRSWETTSDRMNRQANATSNTHSSQNRDEQDGSWETTSSRMNRQANATANTHSNSVWIRNEQNRNNSNAAAR
jgi:hypothetical protein